MRENIASVLGIPVDSVSVKATTTEEMGFIGSGDGAAAYAIASLRPATGNTGAASAGAH